MRVADDGRGPSGAEPEGFGILGMIERARSVGGPLDGLLGGRGRRHRRARPRRALVELGAERVGV
ncbi:hypothetical protein amrb99_30400 [Actinomadura sp. RB99]|nr:hypothetical protein [Actinomadura sp. RB99]